VLSPTGQLLGDADAAPAEQASEFAASAKPPGGAPGGVCLIRNLTRPESVDGSFRFSVDVCVPHSPPAQHQLILAVLETLPDTMIPAVSASAPW